MIVIFATEVYDELEDIADWIALENPIRALSFVEELKRKSVQLTTMAYSFPLLMFPGNTSIRKRPYKNYLIFYAVDKETVIILHILNAERDYTKIVFKH